MDGILWTVPQLEASNHMNAALISYGALAIAIVCEVMGTSFLLKSEQFTKLAPTLFMALFYAGSFFFLSQALKMVPLGIAYAIWGGLGIVLTAFISVLVFRQALDLAAMVGIGMIVGGVVVMNVFSNSVSH
jgi:small multidrug resistance pump